MPAPHAACDRAQMWDESQALLASLNFSALSDFLVFDICFAVNILLFKSENPIKFFK